MHNPFFSIRGPVWILLGVIRASITPPRSFAALSCWFNALIILLLASPATTVFELRWVPSFPPTFLCRCSLETLSLRRAVYFKSTFLWIFMQCWGNTQPNIWKACLENSMQKLQNNKTVSPIFNVDDLMEFLLKIMMRVFFSLLPATM